MATATLEAPVQGKMDRATKIEATKALVSLYRRRIPSKTRPYDATVIKLYKTWYQGDQTVDFVETILPILESVSTHANQCRQIPRSLNLVQSTVRRFWGRISADVQTLFEAGIGIVTSIGTVDRVFKNSTDGVTDAHIAELLVPDDE